MAAFWLQLNPEDAPDERTHELRRCERCRAPEVRCFAVRSRIFAVEYDHRCDACRHTFRTENGFASASNVIASVIILAVCAVVFIKTSGHGYGLLCKLLVLTGFTLISLNTLRRTSARIRVLGRNPVVPIGTEE